MKPETLLSLTNKKNFVDRVNYAIADQPHVPVEKIELQVWSDDPKQEWYDEFIVITYHGGAIAVRTTTGNSNTANFQEIAKMINGGYYSEVKHYREITTSGEFTQLL